ncbi:Epoxyqueuosine reductase QueG (queuosine biosynthesis) [Syntrophus gentianae]|uniref:Epoxyqueuosine reductase QueG (Queuosine biosynthesis) n=1 Tax=Syntrophus gentianae TaxID=43775 RepID=A0A1H7WEP9_9BACT|nr:4Fe-4S dicluster domain-containing protein [Syntrophus gentianae]SEM19545.1 Epoxyqueuosine reductase QueG (queuosine biosynthesis) [Syntrophus gentianae]
MESKKQNLKEEVLRFCRERDVELVGFAPVERWDAFGEVPPEFRPRALWPFSRTVIVMGLPMLLPIVETTPSVLHKEMYTVVNHKLDTLAYELANFLNGKGYASSFFCRDTYANLKALRSAPFAAFSHVMAAKYAGLGTIGVSHCLLTQAFGPRVRFVSVLTAAELPGDPLLTEELCIKCGACAKCCPKQALVMRKDQVIGDYDKAACLEMHEELVRRRCYPCGICTKVCPIGEDRRLYGGKELQRKYLEEAKALAANPDDPAYASWAHIRKWGSLPEVPSDGKKQQG